MVPTISIRSLHLEYQLWIRELTFYKEEIKIFENHLATLLQKNTGQFMRAQAEHFQNQFIIKDEFIDELKHDVNEQVRLIKDYSKKDLVNGSQDRFYSMQEKLREQMQYLEKDFASLRNEFNSYLTEQIFG